MRTGISCHFFGERDITSQMLENVWGFYSSFYFKLELKNHNRHRRLAQKQQLYFYTIVMGLLCQQLQHKSRRQ